jgi:L-asparaginase II
MLAASVRSGVVETYHDGAVAVCRADGTVVASTGDLDRPFYLRSAAKPFQAAISQESGAGLSGVELALVCASHRGEPAHVAIVESILESAGLSEGDLGCPKDWPISSAATQRLLRGGAAAPRRIWHNCSGKHSGFLRACVAAGWPVNTYLDPEHPLQKRVLAYVSELGRFPAEPVGVDGCGAPVLRTNTRAMATLFATLATEPSLTEIFTVMHRYPALVSNNGEGDALIATSIHAAAKGGAQGCLGIAISSGLGVAVKAWDGDHAATTVAAVAALAAIGAVGDVALTRLASVAAPAVLGGGRPVGVMEPRLDLVIA